MFDAYESFVSFNGTSSNYLGFPKEMPELQFHLRVSFFMLSLQSSPGLETNGSQSKNSILASGFCASLTNLASENL